jgi:hypothetical protein
MAEHRSGWSRKFDEPIAVPDGSTLVSLRDAADYITELSDEDATLPEWQAAIEALMPVANLGGPTMFARIGMMRVLNRHHVGSSIRRERSITGGGGSSRGTNDRLCLRQHEQTSRRQGPHQGIREYGRC